MKLKRGKTNEIIQNKQRFTHNNIIYDCDIIEISKHLIAKLSTPIEEYFTDFIEHQLLQNIL